MIASFREEERFYKQADLKLRPLEPLECLLAFSPSTRRLQWLNLSAWLAFEMCDGRTFSALRQEFADLLGDRIASERLDQTLRDTLAALVRGGLVSTSPSKGGE